MTASDGGPPAVVVGAGLTGLTTAALLWFVENGQMPAWALLIVLVREFAVSGLRMIASDKEFWYWSVPAEHAEAALAEKVTIQLLRMDKSQWYEMDTFTYTME